MKSYMKETRRAAGLTQEQVSQITGIPLGTLRRWEQGVNEPDIQAIIMLADLYGTTTDTILGSRHAEAIEGIKPLIDSRMVDIPLLGNVAAGIPIEMIEVDSTYPISMRKHEEYPDAFLLEVKGESMNRILPNGSYALVDPCKTVDYDGKPYAVCVNGNAATIKRVNKLNNGFELVPDSTDPTFKTELFDYGVEGTDEITVIGRVVYYVLPFDWSF